MDDVVAAISYEPLVRIALGPLRISPHGIFTALGFVIGARLLLADTRRRGISDDVMYTILTRAAVGAIAGARAVYVLNHLGSYESPIEWFKVWEGGISLLGGIAGALAAAAPEARRRGLGFFPIMDLAAPWLPLGIAIGRVGDLVIADHLGATTSLPFGFRCPAIVDVGRTVGSPCPAGEVVHLTAGYDLVVAGVVALVLVALRRVPLYLGERTLILGFLYGTGRFGFDFLRQDVRRFGLTGSQWTALAVVAGTGVLIAARRRRALPLSVTDASKAEAPSSTDGPDGTSDFALDSSPDAPTRAGPRNAQSLPPSTL